MKSIYKAMENDLLGHELGMFFTLRCFMFSSCCMESKSSSDILSRHNLWLTKIFPNPTLPSSGITVQILLEINVTNAGVDESCTQKLPWTQTRQDSNVSLPFSVLATRDRNR